ncbi:MAG TPA: nucleotide exchange factor GrpE [Chthoniobacterales bacterium]
MSTDISTENPEDEAGATAASATPESVAPEPVAENGFTERMTALERDIIRFKDLALRTQADFENFRKRAAREKEDAAKYANTSFLERLIPVLDNFELGLAAARTDATSSAILAGMEMVLKQMQDFLSESGVQAIDAAGQVFDPHLHEALASEPSDDVEEGKVLRQIRKGYRLRDRLIRAANVVVSTGPSIPEEAETVAES